jgi:amino acid transporter
VGLALTVWLLSGIASIFGALCYAELGTIVRESGADFAYLCHVKWYPVAFAFMCAGCLINYPCIVAVQAQTFGEYLFQAINVEVDSIGMFYARKLMELALILLLMFLNFFSLRSCVAKFNIVASASKLIATGIVIGVGFYFLIIKGRTENFEKAFSNSCLEPSQIVSAFYAGLFTYDGWDILNFGAEEIHKPRRTMPLAIVLGLSLVVSIYLLANIAYFAVLDVPTFLSSRAVASTFAQQTMPSFPYLMPLLVCVLMIGSLNSTIFAASRFLHAAAKSGYLPTFISCSNTETDSPRAALIIHVMLVFGMTFVGNVETLINYAGFAQWAQRGMTMLVLFYIRYRMPESSRNAVVTMPIVIPALFFAICASLVVTSLINSIDVAIMSIVILFSATVVYYVFLYERALPSVSSYAQWASKFDYVTTAAVQVVLNVMPQRRTLTHSDSTLAPKQSLSNNNGIGIILLQRKVAPSVESSLHG